MANILSWIVTGLIVGALARLLLPGRQPIGFLGTILLGIAGAFAGGLVASLVMHGTINNLTVMNADWRWEEWAISVLGGVAVLWLYVAATTPRRDATPVRRTSY